MPRESHAFATRIESLSDSLSDPSCHRTPICVFLECFPWVYPRDYLLGLERRWPSVAKRAVKPLHCGTRGHCRQGPRARSTMSCTSRDDKDRQTVLTLVDIWPSIFPRPLEVEASPLCNALNVDCTSLPMAAVLSSLALFTRECCSKPEEYIKKRKRPGLVQHTFRAFAL